MAVLPQSSLAWYVLVMSSGQVFPSDTSDMKVIVGFAVQSSVAVTADMSGAGTSPMHSTVMSAGHVITGSIVSSIVII